MSEEGDESASFEIQLIRLDIFSVGGFKRNFEVIEAVAFPRGAVWASKDQQGGLGKGWPR